jgi:hypothetical protein
MYEKKTNRKVNMRALLIINIEVVFVCKYLNFAKPAPAIPNNAYYLNSKNLSNHKHYMSNCFKIVDIRHETMEMS